MTACRPQHNHARWRRWPSAPLWGFFIKTVSYGKRAKLTETQDHKYIVLTSVHKLQTNTTKWRRTHIQQQTVPADISRLTEIQPTNTDTTQEVSKHGHDTGSITESQWKQACDQLVRESTRLTLVFWTISLRALTPYLDSTVDISHWHHTPHYTVHGIALTTRQSWQWYDTVGRWWWTASLCNLTEPQTE